MNKFNILFTLAAIALLSCQTASARGIRVPFGTREVINIVAELPDSVQYETEDGNFIDMATIHEEYNIAYFLPLYIEKEPRLVGYSEVEDIYYEMTDEQLAEILQENNLDGEKLNRLGFYTRYGGKLVALILIGLIIYGYMSSRNSKEEETQA